MGLHFLDFEQPIAELEAKIEELRIVNQGGDFDVGIEEEITKLREKNADRTKKIFDNLGAWQFHRLPATLCALIRKTTSTICLLSLMS